VIDLFRIGSICSGSVRFDQYDLYWFGSIWTGSVRFVVVRFDL
jgi:hypothetical protein